MVCGRRPMADERLSLASQPALPFSTVGRVSLWIDYGEVGDGASRAHYVLAENGSEYIAKGPSFNPELPYVAANELLAASFASFLALPLLDFKLITHDHALYFGSAWLDKRVAFYPALTRELFERANNKVRSYDIVTFDYWICNVDRHQHNLLLRKDPLGGGAAELLVLNDHSHSIIKHGSSPPNMTDYVDEVPPVQLDFLRDSITSQEMLSNSVSLIEGIGNGTIDAICSNVPEAFLSAEEADGVSSFLKMRRDKLRSMINATVAVFPNLTNRAI